MRQAVRPGREAEHRADAGELLPVVGGLQGAHAEGAPGRHVPRRRKARRGSGEVQPGAPQEHGRLEPPRRARSRDERGRRRSAHRAPEPGGAICAAPRGAYRPLWHDRLAQGRRGRGREIRRSPGVLRSVQVRRARGAGSHRSRPLSGYWNKGEVHFERVTYLPIIDATVRLANLRSGQLDLIERMAASDVPSLKGETRFKVAKIGEIGYQGITINVGKSEEAKKTALGRDPRVREAFELSLDRDGIVQVAMDGEADSGNQWVSPNNPWYAKNVPIPKRDVAKAKALLKAAGVANPVVTLMTPTTSDSQRIAQVVQAMAKEAGFDVKIQSTEFATSLNLADKGQFDAYVLAWSGRADPDGNLFSFHACKQPLNYAGYCKEETDELIKRSRSANDPAQRLKIFEQIAAEVVGKERPIVYLFHRHWLWAHTAKLSGFRVVPDGMVRVQGLKISGG